MYKNFLTKLGGSILKVYLNRISGIDDAIVSMYMSKRTWTRELEEDIRKKVKISTNNDNSLYDDFLPEVKKWINRLVEIGTKHITLLRFIDMNITVEGLHRAGQDDWDSHAKRFNNRIVRSSTRLANFGNEKSDYYKNKIITTDEALSDLKIEVPKTIWIDGAKYVKTVNGYIREDLEENKDVKRGLYMLSIPSNFIFSIDLCEFAHVYKERGLHGTANPEVKQCCEEIASQLESLVPQFNRTFLMDVKN